VVWYETGIAATRKSKGVDEKETEDHDDAGQNTPPQLLVHQRFGLLLSIDEILHRCVQRIKSPHVEASQSSGKRENN